MESHNVATLPLREQIARTVYRRWALDITGKPETWEKAWPQEREFCLALSDDALSIVATQSNDDGTCPRCKRSDSLIELNHRFQCKNCPYDEDDEIEAILRHADDPDHYDGDESIDAIVEGRILPDLKTLADAYRALRSVQAGHDLQNAGRSFPAAMVRALESVMPGLDCDYFDLLAKVYALQAEAAGSASFHMGVERGKRQQLAKSERLIEELIQWRAYWKNRAKTFEGQLRAAGLIGKPVAGDPPEEYARIASELDKTADWVRKVFEPRNEAWLPIVGPLRTAARMLRTSRILPTMQPFGERQCPNRRKGDMCSPYAINPPPPWDLLQGGNFCIHCREPMPTIQASGDRDPTEVTDEMVERALVAWLGGNQSGQPDSDRRYLRAALEAAING